MKEKITKICIIIAIIGIVIYNLFIKNKIHNNDNLIQDFIITNTMNYSNTSQSTTPQNTSISSNVENEKIKIYITGEVNKPGVYELKVNSRVEDAITIAGGTTSNANLQDVNLAFILDDAMKIYIPNKNDITEEKPIISSDSSSSVALSSGNDSSNSSKININKATLSDLEKIPGVGPSIAQKIITYREENGKFSSIDDLKNVSGIGSKKFETIKDYISV